MTSTYLSYQLLTRDLTRSLAQTAANPVVSRDAKYYQENIGKVKTVDEFINNSRLFSYAMKANGLEDMTYAKAFMKKVLESDLSDSTSFAMKLTDSRYVQFAQSFNFGTDGNVKTDIPFVQADYQESEVVGLYSEHRTRAGTAAATEAQYYQNHITSVQSVDDLLKDDRLFNYALSTYGIDASIASKAKIRDVLLSDTSDPDSVASKYGARYVALANAFHFEADGSAAAGGAQSAAEARDTVFLNYQATGNGSSPAAAALQADYYSDTMATITNVDDFVNDSKLFDTALTAFGLDPATNTTASIRAVLTSDLSDPNSVANTLTDSRYRALAAAFNFNTDGSVTSSDGAQSAANIKTTTSNYTTNFDDTTEKTEQTASATYQARINSIVSVDALIKDKTLYQYVLTAFDLDPDKVSKQTIKQVLTSDVNDPNSFVNRQHDPNLRKLAAAFNFSADGSVAMPRVAMTDNSKLAMVRLYNSSVGSDASASDQAAAKEENTYFTNTIGSVQTVDDLLNDKRMVAYLIKGFGLDSDVTKDTLKKVLTSDPYDEDSFANKQGNTSFRNLAAAFNFNADGTVARAPTQQVQTRGDVIKTADSYLRMTMEGNAGEENEGVRLALYFQRKAPVIDSAYDILADKALYEVVRTALGLPDTIATASTDAQAAMLEKRLTFTDFQDSKKLDRFLAQFSTFYDMNNGNTTGSSITSLISVISASS